MIGSTFDLGLSRERVDRDGRKCFISLKLRNIPRDATDSDIRSMLEHVDHVRSIITEASEAWNLEPSQSRPQQDKPRVNVDAFAPEIPDDSEIETSGYFWGEEIHWPPVEWLSEGITEINDDGSGGGQLKALNAALTALGYGKHLRHAAAAVLLGEYGHIYDHQPRKAIASLRDLTKAEAHVILTFIERAANTEKTALLKHLDRAMKDYTSC